MIIKSSLVVVLSLSFYDYKTLDSKYKSYQPYNVNRIITTKDMYDTTKLIEQIFIKEDE